MHGVADEGGGKAQQAQLMGYILLRQRFAQTALQPAESHVQLLAGHGGGVVVHKARELHLRIQMAEQLRRQLQRLIAALGSMAFS